VMSVCFFTVLQRSPRQNILARGNRQGGSDEREWRE